MYAKARRGEIQDFTGIDDPYEPPLAPEITLSTTTAAPEQNARRILDYLVRQGLLRADADADATELDTAGTGAH